MRLEFKVLWFENQMGEMRGTEAAMRRALAGHGLKLEVHAEVDGANVEALAAHQEKFHDFDLVLVDYDLGDGKEKGDTVAQRIRSSFGFTDIIFYSGSPTDMLREKVKDQAIDGVYCSGRTDLRENLINLVNFTVERLSRLEAMRGLAVVTAGRGDDALRSIVRLAHDLMDEAGRDALITAIDNGVNGAAKAHAKIYAKISDLDGRLASRALNSRALLQAAEQAVQAVLDKRPHCAPQLDVLRKYLADVLEPRNNLGHNVEVREEAGWVVRTRGGVEITKQDLAQFRKDLAKHLDNFVSLAGGLGGD